MALTRTQLDSGWRFKLTEDESESAWLSVRSVPTQVHLDLINHRRIPDPFIDMNELAVKWVGEKSWIYQCRFKSPVISSKMAGMSVDLIFKGLDTFAAVWLNEVKVLESDNMFLEHRVDISRLLAPENVLEILFDSALLRGRQLVQQHQDEHRFIARQTEEGRLPVRKAQYNWGWDWGPILMTAGPWKPIVLETYAVRLEDVWVCAEVPPNLSCCTGKIFARVEGGLTESTKVRLSLLLDNLTVFETLCSLDSTGLAHAQFSLDQPALWYPHGYGAQARYELKASLHCNTRSEVLDCVSKLIGFRRCELIQEHDDFGESFYFKINNIDIFCGGSCWIPADSFLANVNSDKYRQWLDLVVQGNQAMIRVWGGGVYEDDSFFSICDELGILVWQDFCFACGSYPTYPSFLESVEMEARQNVRRLRSHPSLIIWAGNNEDYQVREKYGLEYRFEEDKNLKSWLDSSFPARYIYEHLLPKILSEEDPRVIYHPGSPWGNGKHTDDPTVGDIHQWNVWHGSMKLYQHFDQIGGRFVSEFGMEAYPHLETIKRVITDPAQRYPGSMVLDHRNKAAGHERRLLTYVAENFRIKYDMPSFIHLTQIVQSDAMSSAYRSWRRDWGRPGARKCGGALVWQLNDCWPTMSWAVVDYFLVKKPAFYSIARSLDPVAVGVSRVCHDWTGGQSDPTIAAADTKYDVWVASSQLRVQQADLVVRFISIKTGEDVVRPIVKHSIEIAPNGTTEVVQGATVDVKTHDDMTIPFETDRYDPYVIFARLSVDGDEVSTDTAWPQPLKYLDFVDRKVTVEAQTGSNKIYISAQKPVKGLTFEEKQGISLSDNGFDVMPGEEKVVMVKGTDAQSLKWTYVGADAASLSVETMLPEQNEMGLNSHALADERSTNIIQFDGCAKL